MPRHAKPICVTPGCPNPPTFTVTMPARGEDPDSRWPARSVPMCPEHTDFILTRDPMAVAIPVPNPEV